MKKLRQNKRKGANFHKSEAKGSSNKNGFLRALKDEKVTKTMLKKQSFQR